MKSFISEDDIEQAFITRLKNDHRWEHIACDPSPEAKDDPGPTGRASVKECILPEVLRAALRRLNPRIPDEQLDAVFAELRKDFSGEDMTDVNYRLYNRIRNGIKVKLRVGGKDDFDFVRLMDFGCPANNTFTVVNQMWIRGHYNYRRPDVLLFVNGLPVVFIELKNSTVKVSEAYAKNLVSYRKDIPNVFAFNQICVLSNGLETRLGAFNAGYEFFFDVADGVRRAVAFDALSRQADEEPYAHAGDRPREPRLPREDLRHGGRLRERLQVHAAGARGLRAGE